MGIPAPGAAPQIKAMWLPVRTAQIHKGKVGSGPGGGWGGTANVCTASGQVGPGAAKRLSPALSHPCVRPGAEILSIEVWEAQFRGAGAEGPGSGQPWAVPGRPATQRPHQPWWHVRGHSYNNTRNGGHAAVMAGPGARPPRVLSPASLAVLLLADYFPCPGRTCLPFGWGG